MKHHYGDFLDRNGEYWHVIPNRERFAFIADSILTNKDEVKTLTLTKSQQKSHWEQVFDCPNLEELTLHEPSKEQIQATRKLKNIKRLRVTLVRTSEIEFIADLPNLEELILEYVSGFSDLSPLATLTKLRSVYFENLRRVSNFDGLRGLDSLRYLRIDGTLDWNQPIDNFDFLSGLQNLEVLALGKIVNKSSFPAFLSITGLKKLHKISVLRNVLLTQEFAFLEQALPGVEGANWDVYTRFAYSYLELPIDDFRAQLSIDEIKQNHPEVMLSYDGDKRIADPDNEWFEFLGKRAGRVKCTNPKADEKIKAFIEQYADYKDNAKEILKNYIS